MSRRDKNTQSIMNKVDNSSILIQRCSDELVSKYCHQLDNIMYTLHKQLNDAEQISDEQLEYHILNLANTLYFTGSAQEDLGIKEDTCKAIRQEIFSNARDNAKGTVADKNAIAEIMAQTETITLSIYSRSYKKVKMRMEAGYEMLNSLKKIMNKRISELELSNGRYMGGIKKNER